MTSKRKRGSEAARQPPAPHGSWLVRYHPKARIEADVIPAPERKATDNAVDKPASLGPAGRSPWRCIYERIGDVFVIGAVAPEAQKDKAGFDSAVSAAQGAARRNRALTPSRTITSLI
jgi:hypothetical protein